MGRRLGMLGFWLAWGALVAAQIAVFMQRDALGQASTGALIALLQVIKIGPTLARLNDLGRAPDDALYALIPLLNVGLFFQVAFAG
ncbi:MAG TPA: hypothetical protein PKA64_24270, partial [Myxococcota bacterium]|nr:hypothetical protein [Myxococcota bacterium]